MVLLPQFKTLKAQSEGATWHGVKATVHQVTLSGTFLKRREQEKMIPVAKQQIRSLRSGGVTEPRYDLAHLHDLSKAVKVLALTQPRCPLRLRYLPSASH